MAFLKKATLDIKSVYTTDQNGKFKWLDFVKQAAENPSEDRSKFLPSDAYKFDTDHFVYIIARSISGGERWGHNGNYDYFPWEEIKKALPTYPGCGFFIEHKEDDVEHDAKGIVLDAIADEENQYAVCICAIDREQFPEFCQQLLDGTYNQVSMSCLANECECSLCGNVAHSFDELCQHQNPNLPMCYLKGKQDDNGNDIYEINRDLCFTGLSAVAVPADKDAFVFDIKASKKKENKLQVELLKYQNIKKASKMKELKTACEEEFNKLDKFQLLHRMESVLSDINNSDVFKNENVLLDDKLSNILEQMIQLQVGLNLLNLSEVQHNNPPVIEKEVIVEEPKNEEDTLQEEVNLDKEIDSYLSGDNESYTPFSSTASKVSFTKDIIAALQEYSK